LGGLVVAAAGGEMRSNYFQNRAQPKTAPQTAGRFFLDRLSFHKKFWLTKLTLIKNLLK
jgi:hypothetical protein